MKPNKDIVKNFKEQYKVILEFEKQIGKHMYNLKKSARSLYNEGEKNGISNVKSLQKCFSHLDDICYGENSF